jgi:hypothetical protein
MVKPSQEFCEAIALASVVYPDCRASPQRDNRCALAYNFNNDALFCGDDNLAGRSYFAGCTAACCA